MISPEKNRPRKRGPYRPRKGPNKRRYDTAILITIPQSCPITGWGITMSYRKAREGKLPGAAMVDGRWYVNKPKLLAWLETLGTSAA
jgi:hypothetical protein